MNEEVVISLKNVTKSYKLFSSKTDRMKEALDPFKRKFHKEFNALNCLNFEVKRGEIVGIVGMNGAGKSTLLKLIAGIIQQSSGSVYVKGNIVPLLELGSGFNPEYTGVENIYFYNTIMGYSRKETDKMLDRIVDFAEIGDFIDQPLKTYSSGMRARLAFAVAVNIDPDILILDEVLSVGDELFRRKSFSKIEEFFNAGKTILFVSHSSQNVNQLCTRAIMMYNGNIVLDGIPKFVTMNYQKFIFTSPENRELILKDWASGVFPGLAETPVEQRSPVIEDDIPLPVMNMTTQNLPQSESYYLPGYDPKSTLITKNRKVDVSPVKILNSNGKDVNVLVPDEIYEIAYTIVFNEDMGFINHGIGIRTEKGVVITWRFYPGCNMFSEHYYRKGEKVNLRWRFKCQFIPSNYFIGVNIKCKGRDGAELAFRGADYDVFKVLGNKGVDRGGFFDAKFEVEIQQF